MKTIKVKLPVWKIYLYSLLKRWKQLIKINSGKRNFQLSLSNYRTIKKMLIENGKEGVLKRQPKAFILYEYLKTCDQKGGNQLCEEEKIVYKKLSPIKTLFLEDLMAEISELKEFAEEVGLSKKDIKGLDEEDLVAKIAEAVDPDKSYSKEFRKFWDTVEDDYPDLFEESDDDKKGKDNKTMSKEDLIEEIEDADDSEELDDIIKENEDEFEDFEVTKKDKKDFKKYQKAMKEFLEKDKKDKKEEKDDDGDESKEECIAAIKEAEDLDDLKEVLENDDFEDFFEDTDIKIKKKSDFDEVKAQMLKALGIEEKKKDKGKSKEKDKESDGDISSKEDLENMKFNTELKPLGKKLGLKIKPGTSKEETVNMIWKELKKGGGKAKKDKIEKEEKEETEVDQTKVQKLVKAKDIDALIEIAEEMDIKVTSLDKRNARKLGKKIIAELEENEEKEDKKDKKKSSGSLSLYGKIETLAKEGKSEKEIVKELYCDFETAGKDKAFAKEKVKAALEIINIEEDDD